MARKYIVNGDAIVQVKGPPNTDIETLAELGLAEEEDPIRVLPVFKHKGVKCDDFGPDTPPEMLWMLASLRIQMTLVNADPDVVEACVIQAMGGGGQNAGGEFGVFGACGLPMGGGVDLHAAGNHYISLNISSPVLERPWRFPASYLTGPALEYPLGASRSLIKMTWEVVPYVKPQAGIEIVSRNKVFWDRTADTADAAAA